ncbi:MAG: alpha/beta hydrolase [Tychonema bourrellyi B0820]|uniref:Alpha/beta hydrolase n=1 Tax=Tychonema bourrellyi FEM_GT703 TaxID=2040638 RepID=A0A2G4EVR5_9CYAN|nr:alpha/beta hydrolase [Tychonema bourrellyi]MDQ2098568.1 alpha/beta hydrolase [Tychonema bourrellyi B0820]PHX53642.1 alpha/beta hydrolase [Tychonema bourrellyi FEM_GT703]
MTQTTDLTKSNSGNYSAAVQEYLWNWKETQIKVVYETRGQGTPVLLLPAFSTVSTREEMRPLAEILAPNFQVVAVDWPGFGDSSSPRIDYEPQLYHQFLTDFVESIFNTPVAVIAAGHAAGYVMALAQSKPNVWSKIVLAAPTWRGPLPTMSKQQSGWHGIVRELVRSPILGQFLYKLNTAPSFLSFMYRRHVYADPAKVTPDFIQNKWQVTQQPGARYGSAAFVTGGLDPAKVRSEFTDNFQQLAVPVMVVIAENAPPKSKAEMEVLAELPGVESRVISGSLGMHEENAGDLANAIKSFL